MFMFMLPFKLPVFVLCLYLYVHQEQSVNRSQIPRMYTHNWPVKVILILMCVTRYMLSKIKRGKIKKISSKGAGNVNDVNIKITKHNNSVQSHDTR